MIPGAAFSHWYGLAGNWFEGFRGRAIYPSNAIRCAGQNGTKLIHYYLTEANLSVAPW